MSKFCLAPGKCAFDRRKQARPGKLGLVFSAAVLIGAIAGCGDTPKLPPAARPSPPTHIATTPGSKTKLNFYVALNADCSSIGDSTIRIVDPPSHGSVAVEQGTDYPEFASNNQRFECNKHEAPGTIVYYTSAPGYVGSDSVKIESISANGFSRTDTFELKIGTTAQEQGRKEEAIARTVLSGADQKLDFQYSINSDCTSLGDTKIRVLDPRSHGKVWIEAGDGYSEFPKWNSRYECNKQPIPGAIVHYQSEAGFVGQDSVRIEVVYPNQTIRKEFFGITVK